MLVDAPCSGLGTLRRDPDLKWRRREDDLPRTGHERSGACWRARAAVVKPGGRLVYATCSSEPEENERRRRLRSWQATRTSARHRPPGRGPTPPLSSLVTPEGWLRTLPERDGLDAFFAAAFRRAC